MTEGEVASTKKHTWQSGLKTNGKLGPSGRGPAAQPPKQPQVRGSAARKACTAHAREVAGSNPAPVTSLLTCPECGGKRLYRDGLRYLRDGSTAQRWLCRSCGYRFSDIGRFQSGKAFNNSNISEYVERIDTKILRLQPPTSNRRVCDERNSSWKEHGSPVQMKHHGSRRADGLQTTESGNLAKVETREKAQRESTEPDKETIKGKLVEYLFHCNRQGRADSTIRYRKSILTTLISLGANLLDPESVKDVIAAYGEWAASSKKLAVQIYSSFLKTLGLTWERPKYMVPDRMPFVPLEEEIDALISGCGKLMGTFLQGLKDTGADPGELIPTTEIDIDTERKIVRINHPVKGHYAGTGEISDAFIKRVKTLRKRPGGRIFSNYTTMAANFRDQRKRMARKLGNPRLLEISFTTFRHWKGTMEYHKTRDIYYVKTLLRHKRLRSTEFYVHLEREIFKAKKNEFHVKAVKTLDEACKLIEVGFEKVDEIDGYHLYRKRK